VLLCDLLQAMALLAIAMDGRGIQLQGLAADVLAVEARTPHTGAHTLAGQAALKSSKYAGKECDGVALRSAGVDSIAD